MESGKPVLTKSISALLVLSGLLLIVILFVPMWRIELSAPQYPEGLLLLIYPDKIAGDVDIINGLNHYIGMKTLHTADFVEFKILPYIISVFALLCFITAALRKKSLLIFLFFAFVAFGCVAMIDFWKWEYDYGHNLNPDAAIVVPGMAYQPPLIGFKQLLNFGAYSIPALGGWLFVLSGLILAVSLFLSRNNKNILKKSTLTLTSIIICTLPFYSCTSDPKAFRLGIDHCSYCSMTITNPRFGGEMITGKGKIFKFDDLGCMLNYLKSNNKTAESKMYSVDYSGNSSLLNLDSSIIVKNEKFRSPMGSNLASFPSQEEAASYMNEHGGTTVSFKELHQ